MIYYKRIKKKNKNYTKKYTNKRGEKMLFKNANQVTPCGLFSIGHLLLFTITMISIVIALKLTKNIKQEKVKEKGPGHRNSYKTTIRNSRKGYMYRTRYQNDTNLAR